MRSTRLPAYSLHRPSGRAVVKLPIDGKQKSVYLGQYNSPESFAKYHEVVGDWVKSRRAPAAAKHSVSVDDLATRFLHQHNKRPDKAKAAMRMLTGLFGGLPVASFSALQLQHHRAELCRKYSRAYAQECLNQTIEAFRQALIWDMISADTFVKLQAAAVRVRADEAATKIVEPVDDAVVAVTLPELPETIALAVQFIRLVGCRPGEAIGLRVADVDQVTWVCELRHHKNAHRGKPRFLALPKAARELILPRLSRPGECYIFSPDQHGHRKYERRALGRAIDRGIKRANAKREALELPPIPHWHAYQLRHARAVEVRERHNAEVAQVVLGHSKIDMTEHYAKLTKQRAQELAAQFDE